MANKNKRITHTPCVICGTKTNNNVCDSCITEITKLPVNQLKKLGNKATKAGQQKIGAAFRRLAKAKAQKKRGVKKSIPSGLRKDIYRMLDNPYVLPQHKFILRKKMKGIEQRILKGANNNEKS